jgi:phage shock protein PspC (stress-responsive transcriptional regulator)
MKKVININFQGTVIPIEESSYEILQQYIESLRRHFSREEGRDEIVNDIESRISELFQEKLKAGATCITDDDVNAILKNMGRPEEFDDQENEGHANTDNSTKNENAESIFNSNFDWKGKKLYRDEAHKVLGGVCSGVAAYFGIDPVIARVVFILFAFTGFGVLLYLLLWIFVPGSILLENGVRKRLYRNPDGKIIGGVCSGIGSYFSVNPWIPRVLFLIPFISFIFRWTHWVGFGFPQFWSFSVSPGAIIIYIILWLVVPEANTTSEKLEMKGEKVDMNSIKESVLKEMKDVGERVGKMGAAAGKMAAERGPEMGQQFHQAASRGGSAVGNVIVTLVKIFVYFILGCIALSLIVGLFALAIAAVGIFPLKDFLLNDGWQTVFAWGTLIFFVAVPVVGIITFIIRRLARTKSKSNFMGFSFGGLWVIGWVFFILLISSVARDFKGISSMNETPIALSNPNVAVLEVSPIQNVNMRRNGWFRLEPFNWFSSDTAMIGNVRIRIKKSMTDSFQVTTIKTANGNTRKYADTLASLISFNINQQDTLLKMDRAIMINKTDKFRNQNVEVTIYVPVGRRIKIDRSFRNQDNIRINSFSIESGWYDYNDDNDYQYNYGVEYIMKEDGLYNIQGISSAKEDDWNRDENPDQNNVISGDDSGYRYNKGTNFDSLKALQEQKIRKMEAAVDSAKAAQKKVVERMKDSLQKVKDELEKKIDNLNKNTARYEDEDFRRPTYNATFSLNI